ncbi:MAG: ABC transporter permease subunit [Luteitalea sp.]
MLRALAARLVFAVLLVVLAFAGAYVLIAAAPGSDQVGADEGLSRDQRARERARLGLDRPVTIRVADRLRRLAVLDLGTSRQYGRPVRSLVIERASATVQAGLLALLLAVALGIPAGVVATRTRWPALRQLIATVSVALLSMPPLVLALALAAAAATTAVPSLLVTVVALALPAAALLERLQARALSEALQERCLHAARARGVPDRRVTWRHAWPLSVPAVLGVGGVIGSHLVSGSLAVELVTSRPGLGLLTSQALMTRDADLAAGCAGAAALLVGAVTFAADALQLWLDPRTTT